MATPPGQPPRHQTQSRQLAPQTRRPPGCRPPMRSGHHHRWCHQTQTGQTNIKALSYRSSRSGSRLPSVRPPAGACSNPCAMSTPGSARSSTAGTTAAIRSCGPRPPTKSSRRPTVQLLQTHAPSAAVHGTSSRSVMVQSRRASSESSMAAFASEGMLSRVSRRSLLSRTAMSLSLR